MAPDKIKLKASREEHSRAAELCDHIRAEFDRLETEGMASGLYLVATPIGHLGDITVRALSILARADKIYAEDTRKSRVLLERYGIKKPLNSYHEHNAKRAREQILKDLDNDLRVALISDAGTPLISDPGYKLVRETIAADHRVQAIPGASAPLAALSIAGQPTDCFLFAGFLPTKRGERRTRIEALQNAPATLIFFESPTRIAAAMDDLLAGLGPRPAALTRELTKRHEEVVRGSLTELSEKLRDTSIKGECVIVIGPPGEQKISDTRIANELQERLTHESLREAAKAIAKDLGVSKSRVYDIGLKLKGAK